MSQNRQPRCKICSLPEEFRNEINQMLFDGFAYSVVADKVNASGLTSVTAPSVNRHAIIHLEGYKPRTELPGQQNLTRGNQKPSATIPTESPGGEFSREDVLALIGEVPEGELESTLIRHLITNHLLYLVGRQENFFQKGGKYPDHAIHLSNLLQFAKEVIEGRELKAENEQLNEKLSYLETKLGLKFKGVG